MFLDARVWQDTLFKRIRVELVFYRVGRGLVKVHRIWTDSLANAIAASGNPIHGRSAGLRDGDPVEYIGPWTGRGLMATDDPM